MNTKSQQKRINVLKGLPMDREKILIQELEEVKEERDAAVKLLTEISESLDRAEDVRKTNLRTRISTYLRG